MEKYEFNEITKESLQKLYSDFGFRLKEIGLMVGVSEDAVLKRIKNYGIPTNPRDKKKADVEVLYTGKKKDKRSLLTDSELIRLCKIGHSDAAIGNMFNMTGEGIAYRRKKLEIPLSFKNNETKNLIQKLKDTSRNILEKDYYDLTQEEFSSKYGISKIVWRPHLKSIGIVSKETHRIDKYPPFNRDQRSLIIGSLLGDGAIDKTRFYESHSNKQRLYLVKKFQILEPYSSNMYPCDNATGMRFSTINHPNFSEFYKEFYEEGINGKLIPVELIKNNWSEDILAYWFFDDGSYDDEKNEFYIYNLCPKRENLESFLDFLNSIYPWNFNYSFYNNIYNIKFSKKFYEDFVNILLKIATPDLYYKIPEKYLTKDMITLLSFDSISSIKPKFYRLSDDNNKKKIEIMIFNHFRKVGFPYSNIKPKRLNYLLDSFKNTEFKVNNGTIDHNTVGVKLCEYFFPNIYECKRNGHRSPLDQWNNDKDLQNLIKNRLNYSSRLSDSSIRTGIKLIFNSVTNFKPGIAKYIYSKYAPNGKVYDYSCGFGSRMLAAMSLGMEYVGCEPNLKTFSNLNKFGEFLKSNIGGSYFITESGSEDFVYKENYFDIAFSSPPFFDYEIYSDDPGQSIVKYPVYEEWLINFWKKTIDNCKRSIISGGYFGNCISINNHEKLIESTKCFCEELGLVLCDEIKAPYKQLLNENKDKYDIILIFKKL